VSVIRFYDRDEPYFELTNFFAAEITVEGARWPTSEHYYQAKKFTDPALQEQVRRAGSPREARELGRRLGPLRADFDSSKIDVMRAALRAKFTQHEDLRALLMDTGDARLIEASPHDSFWGEGRHRRGQNWLGQLLVELRDELRAEG
jgi:ribA/ribD-fused uncharacterized protein